MAKSSVLFYSAYNQPPTFPEESGSKMIDDFTLKVVDGEEILVKTGTIDIYDSKQEALEGTYLPRMIERFMNGNISPVDFDAFKNEHSWEDLDVTGAPKNLAELQQLAIDTDKAFYGMPADVRDLFGDNKYKFVQALQSGKAYDILSRAGYVKKAANENTNIPKKEVNEKGDSK